VLAKYDVAYLYCESCGYLRTEEPHWLAEAYSQAILDADTGILQRNLRLARILSGLCYYLGRDKRYVDVGGGYGVLTRLMRDYGFDFWWSDPHAENLFARLFVADRDAAPWGAVTFFEVLEHIVDPVAWLKETLDAFPTDTLIFTTETFAGEPPAPGTWWYYVPEGGQHVSFFQARTLTALAERFGLRYLAAGASVHVMSKKDLSPTLLKFLAGRGSHLVGPVIKRTMKSLTEADHAAALDELKLAQTGRKSD
jgi:methyltransferase family protein